MTCSFVIPVFKTEAYLPRCLDSLAAQTDGDFEAIVVDDCSPMCENPVDAASSPREKGADPSSPDAEGTPRPRLASEIVARYDGRFRYIRQDRNRSTFQAKATGARAATGDYIVPLDSDDYVGPRLVAEIKREACGEVVEKPCDLGRAGVPPPAADGDGTPSLPGSATQPSTFNLQPDLIVYQMVKEYRGKTYPVKYNHPAGRCTGEEALGKLFAGRIFMPVCGKAIRREVFLKAYEGLAVGPDFYLNFTDDLCWLIPILLNTQTVSFITYPGYRYWRHDDSMTKDVMAPERIRSLAEQSQKSVAAVVVYAERLRAAARESRAVRDGVPVVDDRVIAKIRAQLYPTIRWLMRDMGQTRAALEAAYGADLVAATLAWDASAGGFPVKMLRHLVTYGFVATVREIIVRIRGVEI